MRTGLTLAIILGFVLVSLVYQHWIQKRTPTLLPDLGPLRPDAFVLVYFTTPSCVPCKTVQRPAIQQLSQQMGNTLQVLEIDATQKPELANRWGVMSVPTTFVIDPKGKVRHINHGVVRVEKLRTQIGITV